MLSSEGGSPRSFRGGGGGTFDGGGERMRRENASDGGDLMAAERMLLECVGALVKGPCGLMTE